MLETRVQEATGAGHGPEAVAGSGYSYCRA